MQRASAGANASSCLSDSEERHGPADVTKRGHVEERDTFRRHPCSCVLKSPLNLCSPFKTLHPPRMAVLVFSWRSSTIFFGIFATETTIYRTVQ